VHAGGGKHLEEEIMVTQPRGEGPGDEDHGGIVVGAGVSRLQPLFDAFDGCKLGLTGAV
jgi:hypothetical protein